MTQQKIILFLLLFVLTISSYTNIFCQIERTEIIYSGIIKNKDTGEKLQYVNIGIKNSIVGTVSDLNGNYQLKVPDSLSNNKLTFSSIGYNELSLKISNFRVDTIINVNLQPETYTLSETNILSNYLKQRKRGLKSKNKKMVVAINGKSFGSEVGSPIRIRHKETLLKTFHFNIITIKPDSAVFRLKIYNMSGDTIGANLLNKDILFIIRKDNLGEYQVNLIPHNIVVNNDIFISIELLNIFPVESIGKTSFSDRINASAVIALSNGGVFQKKASFGKWEKVANNFAIGFWLTTLE